MKVLDRVDRVHIYLRIIIQVSLVVALILEAYNQRWGLFFVTALALLLTYLPLFFEKRYKIYLPLEAQLLTVIFIYASVFLGEVKGYYDRFWWWDSVLHLGAGLALGLIGFGIMYVLYKTGRITASPIFIAFIAFCFSMTGAVVWEIYEFGMDVFLGTNMQRLETGVVDTMLDLIINTVGAIIASVAGYLYIKKGDNILLNRLVRKFAEKNPQLFNW
jgi:hypothetical protein